MVLRLSAINCHENSYPFPDIYFQCPFDLFPVLGVLVSLVPNKNRRKIGKSTKNSHLHFLKHCCYDFSYKLIGSWISSPVWFSPFCRWIYGFWNFMVFRGWYYNYANYDYKHSDASFNTNNCLLVSCIQRILRQKLDWKHEHNLANTARRLWGTICWPRIYDWGTFWTSHIIFLHYIHVFNRNAFTLCRVFLLVADKVLDR